MQVSEVFSQRAWWGAKDLDDCWVISALQAANVTSPWLRLVGVKAFRRQAGNRDVQGQANGGDIDDIKRGLEGCYPSLKGKIRKKTGTGWMDINDLLDRGHPLSVAIDSSKLPRDLQFGFKGLHQITLAVPVFLGPEKVLYANPLAPEGSRWLKVKRDDLKAAVMGFGTKVNGNRGAWAVVLPTDDEAMEIRHVFTDETPFDQDDLDDFTKDLQDKIDRAIEVLD